MATNETKHTIEITDEEAYIIRTALEQFADIDDSDYSIIASKASKLWGKIPPSSLNWSDVAY